MDRKIEMENWYSGLPIQSNPSYERIKRFLINKFGPFCFECGWSNRNPFTGKWVIDLDHIDGDHTNFKPSNFRLLCPNCHAMTPTYKALNHKSKRDSRGVCQELADSYDESYL